jgi:hypothetical protein
MGVSGPSLFLKTILQLTESTITKAMDRKKDAAISLLIVHSLNSGGKYESF